MSGLVEQVNATPGETMTEGAEELHCSGCRKLNARNELLERRLAEAEDDYAEIVEANIRIVKWARDANLKIPSSGKLKSLYDLSTYTIIRPRRK